VLDAVFDYDFEEHNDPHTAILSSDPRGVHDLLSSARLEFLHDQCRLDHGLKAELVLRPVGRETVDNERGIKPARNLMILGLALIELWQETDAQLFKHMSQVQIFVAEGTENTPGTITTERSNFNNNKKCSPEEQANYRNTIALARNMAEGSGHSPFALLLPAFRALSSSAYPRGASASR
jgi:hypothetical protein